MLKNTLPYGMIPFETTILLIGNSKQANRLYFVLNI